MNIKNSRPNELIWVIYVPNPLWKSVLMKSSINGVRKKQTKIFGQ